MSRIVIAAAVILMVSTPANAAEPLTLRDMGSFHIGGRLVEISGKPVKEVTFTPGGVPAKVDPNGTYQVEQMYVQYFLPANEKGAYPLLMWHGGGLTGVTYETTPDGREGWLNYFTTNARRRRTWTRQRAKRWKRSAPCSSCTAPSVKTQSTRNRRTSTIVKSRTSWSTSRIE